MSFSKLAEGNALANLEVKALGFVSQVTNVMPRILETLEKVKPLNLLCLLLDIFMARTHRSALIAIARLAEMYGLFWNLPETLLEVLKELLYLLIQWIVSGVEEVKLLFKRFFKSEQSDRYTEAEFESRCREITKPPTEKQSPVQKCKEWLQGLVPKNDLKESLKKMHYSVSETGSFHSAHGYRADDVIIEIPEDEELFNEALTMEELEEEAFRIVKESRQAERDEKAQMKDFSTRTVIEENKDHIPSIFKNIQLALISLFESLKDTVNGFDLTHFSKLKKIALDNLDKIPILGWGVAVIFMVSASIGVGTSIIPKKFIDAVVQTGNLARASTTICKSAKQLAEVTTLAAGHALGEDSLTKTPRDKVVETGIALNDSVSKLLHEINTNPTEALLKPGFFRDIESAYSQYQKLTNDLALAKENTQGTASLMIDLRKNIDAVHNYAESLQKSIIGKQEPVVLYMYGESGVGKSVLKAHIIDMLSKLNPDQKPLTTYSRNIGDVFWSGYCGQDVVIYDDFNCAKEDGDHNEMVQIYTNEAFLPRMAEISEKGMRFSSRFVIVCSNMGVVMESSTIKDLTILDRRRDFIFEVKNKLLSSMKKTKPNLTPDEIAACYNKDFSHLTLTQMGPFRGENLNLTPLNPDSAMKTPQEICVAMTRLETQKRLEFNNRLLQKKSTFKAFSDIIERGVNQTFQDAFNNVAEIGVKTREMARETKLMAELRNANLEHRLKALGQLTPAQNMARKAFGLHNSESIVPFLNVDFMVSKAFARQEELWTKYAIFNTRTNFWEDSRGVEAKNDPMYDAVIEHRRTLGTYEDLFSSYTLKNTEQKFEALQKETFYNLSYAWDDENEKIITAGEKEFNERADKALAEFEAVSLRVGDGPPTPPDNGPTWGDLVRIEEEQVSAEQQAIMKEEQENRAGRKTIVLFEGLKQFLAANPAIPRQLAINAYVNDHHSVKNPHNRHTVMDKNGAVWYFMKNTRLWYPFYDGRYQPEHEYANQAREEVIRLKPVLLMGPPGTGKTSFCRTDPDLIDEFPNDKELFDIVVKEVADTYDNNPVRRILTCNETSLVRMFAETFPNDSERYISFMRRCEVFRFDFRYKSRVFRTKYTHEDVTNQVKPHEQMVSITASDGQEVTATWLHKHISELAPTKDVIAYATELREIELECDDEFLVNLTYADTNSADYNLTLSELMNLIKVKKGHLTNWISFSRKIAHKFQQKVGTIEDVFISLNNEFADEKITRSLGILLRDGKRYVLATNEHGHAEFFKSLQFEDAPTLLNERFAEAKSKQCADTNLVGQLVSNIVDAFLFFIKVGFVFSAVNSYKNEKEENNKNHQFVQYIGELSDESSRKPRNYYDQLERHMRLPPEAMRMESGEVENPRRNKPLYVIEDDDCYVLKGDRYVKYESGEEARDRLLRQQYAKTLKVESGEEARDRLKKQQERPVMITERKTIKHEAMDLRNVGYSKANMRLSNLHNYMESSWAGALVRTTDEMDAGKIVEDMLFQFPEMKVAAHVTIAMRYLGSDNKIHELSRDDGETHMGTHLIKLMRAKNVIDRMFVLTRWYGSVHTGQERFKMAELIMEEVLEGYERMTRGDPLGQDHAYTLVPVGETHQIIEHPNGMRVKKELFKNEAMADPGAHAVMMKIMDNVVSVVDRQDRRLLNAIMVKGHVGVTNAHGARGETVLIDLSEHSQNYVKNVVEAKVIYRDSRQDIVFFQIPKNQKQYSDISTHLMRKSEVNDFTGNSAILATCEARGKNSVFVWRDITLGTLQERPVEGVARYGINYTGHLKGASYDAVLTQAGDCCAPIVIQNTTLAHKWLGFHGAAGTHTGFGSILTKDLVEMAMLNLTNESKEEIVVLPHQCVRPLGPGYMMGKAEAFGVCEKDGQPLHQHGQERTKYYESPFEFSEKFGRRFEPAMLHDKDKRKNPDWKEPIMATCVEKWVVEQPVLDQAELDLAATEIGYYLAQKIQEKGLKIGVLTKTEAINGVSYLPGSNPIYRKSSVGFPFKHWKGVKCKDDLMRMNDRGIWVIDEGSPLGHDLSVAVDGLIRVASQGKRSAVVFTCTLKDEPLKLKKIYDVMKTRSFTACPIDYTLANRRYFHAAAAAITGMYDEIPVKIGINPASVEWHGLYMYHACKNTVGFDGDFANWDATIPADYMRRIPVIFNIIYKECDPNHLDVDDTIRTNLHACLHGPLVTYYDTVVKLPGGNPSGQPQTALDNCLVNWMLAFICWRRIMKNNGREDLMGFGQFMENVASSFYGDDNMFTMKAEVQDMFNFVTFKKECEQLGFTLTNATKDDQEVPLKPLLEMEFLKRNFVKIEGKYYGALIDDSVCKMLAFCTKTHPHIYDPEDRTPSFDRATIAGTVETALLECSLKGEEFYKEIRQHLIKRCAAYHIRGVKFPSYIDMRDRITHGVKLTRLLPNGLTDEAQLSLRPHSTL